MADLADAYTEIQARLIETVLAIDVPRRNAGVAACPDWTVTEVISQSAGGVLDVGSGNAPECEA